MDVKKMVSILAIVGAAGIVTPALGEEPSAEILQLKDGSTLYLHPDGTSRMIDQHGKPMSMADGEKMETEDGRVLMMENKRIWVRYGPPGRERVTPKID